MREWTGSHDASAKHALRVANRRPAGRPLRLTRRGAWVAVITWVGLQGLTVALVERIG